MTKEENLINTIKFAKNKLENVPQGTLLVRNQHGRDRYIQRIGGDNPKEIYLKGSQKDLVKALQEKAYYEELLKTATRELEGVRRIRKIEAKLPNSEQVFSNIPGNRRSMIEPYVSPETEEVKRKIEKECKIWQRDSNIRKGVEKNIQLVTLNGERVRSKSELIIADRLFNAGIPYCYEGKQLLVDEEARDYEAWFPDFQMFNVKNGRKYYWEHFGLMDNPNYCASCQYKLEVYAKYGIIQGKNLIITMESSKHSLNTAYVDCLIKEFLK